MGVLLLTMGVVISVSAGTKVSVIATTLAVGAAVVAGAMVGVAIAAGVVGLLVTVLSPQAAINSSSVKDPNIPNHFNLDI